MTARPPRITHVLETALYVADLDRSRRFYETVIGLETLGQDQRMCALAVPGGTVLLLFRSGASLHPIETEGGVIPPHGADGPTHLCFAIPVSQREAWVAHLAACGVALESRVRQSFGGTSLYFRDPDGHSLEAATPGLWLTY